MSHQNTGAVMEYDEQGDLVIRIPQHLLTPDSAHAVALAIKEQLELMAVVQTEPDWAHDPLLKLIGRFQSDVSDGALHHDRYLY